MAYLILEENEPGTASAYIEFNAENGDALEKIEALLKARHASKTPVVEQLGDIAGESTEAPCEQRPAAGWLTHFNLPAGIVSRKKCRGRNGSCTCGKQRPAPGIPHGIAPTSLSPIS